MENRQSIIGEIIAKLLMKLGIRSEPSNIEITAEERHMSAEDVPDSKVIQIVINDVQPEDEGFDPDIWYSDTSKNTDEKWDVDDWFEEEQISKEHRQIYAQYGYNPIKIAKLTKIETPIKPIVLPRIIDASEFEKQIIEMENQVIRVLGADFRRIAEIEDIDILKPQSAMEEDKNICLKKRVEKLWEQIELSEDENDVLNSNQYVAEIKEIYKKYLLYKRQMISYEEYEAFKDDCLAEYWEKEPSDVVYQKQMKALRRLEL